MRPLQFVRMTLVVNMIVTIVAMTLAYRAMVRADESGRLVVRSHRTLQAAEETLRRAVDAETGARGFLLTHSPADSDRYRRGRESVGGALGDLERLLTEDGRGDAVGDVKIRLTETLAYLERLERRASDGQSIDQTENDAARASMDALRAEVRSIRDTENGRLTGRMERDGRDGRRVNVLLLVMTGLATALLTLLVASLAAIARPGAWRP